MKIVLVCPNANVRMGGEAMKAFQYIRFLAEAGADLHVIVHERSGDELKGVLPNDRLHIVEDTWLQVFAWKSGILRLFILPIFHFRVSQIVRKFRRDDCIVHYVSPISPVQPRFLPAGYTTIVGPLNGNIYAPPAFADRLPSVRRMAGRLHIPVQRMFGRLVGDMRRAGRLLNSGGERTRESLLAARARPERIVAVADSGVAAGFANIEPIRHEGRNTEFVCMARLIPYKGVDLAIRALAEMPDDYRLTVIGDGEMRGTLEELTATLGLGDRVTFAGYLSEPEIIERVKDTRALLFPSVAEANGIVVQEAMMLGLVVVALNWGGPASLIDADCGVLIEPESEVHIVAQLAAQMRRLAEDPDLAQRLADAARRKALTHYTWDAVAQSWMSQYGDMPGLIESDRPQSDAVGGILTPR